MYGFVFRTCRGDGGDVGGGGRAISSFSFSDVVERAGMALRVKSVGGMRDEECGGTDSEPFCRICLGGSDEMECGDLLTPCNCSGSCK